MPYIYLLVSVFMGASSSVFGKFFGRKNEGVKDATKLYNFLQLSIPSFLSNFVSGGIKTCEEFQIDLIILSSAVFLHL